MSRPVVFAVAASVAVAWSNGPAAAEPLRIVVVPFETRAALQGEVAGVIDALLSMLAEQGADAARSARGAADGKALEAVQVRRIALAEGADAVVSGRASREAESPASALDLEIELRSGHSGGLLGTWPVRARPFDDAELAGELGPAVSGMRDALGFARPPVAAAPVGAPSPSQDGSADERDSMADSLRSDEPIAIQSDQLDVVEKDGRRHLVFQHNVHVKQGDITLRTRKLDAFYAEGESQPQRLVASGSVRVVQGERTANCDEATYLRADQRIVCSGRAMLTQGCDVVRGGRIEFDLDRDHLRVTGAASVVLGKEGEQCGGEPS